MKSIDLPRRVVVGANGAYWRDYGGSYSMCPVSEDNDPIEVVAVYVRDYLDHDLPDVGESEEATIGPERPCPSCGTMLSFGETHWSLFAGIAGSYVCPEIVR